MKTLEIYYDIADIPGITDRGPFSGEALSFRNEAMEFIEDAMMQADAGEWVGAEIGQDEVNFGFDVEDFDKAEEVVRNAVAGSKYANIRECERREISEEELAEMEAQAAQYDSVKPMNFLEVIGLLVFRRLPKRFRER